MPRIKQYAPRYKVQDLNQWISDQLNHNGLKQSDLAELLHLTQQSISYKMHSRTSFTIEELVIMFKFFGTDVETIGNLLKL